jgi:hypothetical protein
VRAREPPRLGVLAGLPPGPVTITWLGVLLLPFVRGHAQDVAMKRNDRDHLRLDVAAAIRGGDPEQAMEGEQAIGTSSLDQALFWRGTYREILTMEEGVMARIRELMATQSETARREVELSNVPVIAAQVERFRSRLGYREARVRLLRSDGHSPAK